MNLEERAYELYKIDWVRENVTKEMELKTMQEYFDYRNECMEIDSEIDSYDEWLFDNGFANGMIYVCFEEFCDEEFCDEEYMEYLLSEPDFDLWKQFNEE